MSHFTGVAREHNYLGDATPINHTTGSEFAKAVTANIQVALYPINVVLFPHETIPLRITATNMIKHVLLSINRAQNLGDPNAILLGVIALSPSQLSDPQLRDSYFGTVVKLESVVNNSFNDDEEVSVTARGIHRFRLLSDPQSRNGILFAKIEKLNDFNMPPLQAKCLRVGSLLGITPSILNNLDPHRLTAKARDLIIHNEPIFGSSLIHTMPPKNNDLTFFVFWLCSNLPLSSNDRLELLSCHAVLGDMLLKILVIIEIMMRKKHMLCRRCNNKIAKKSDILAVPGANGTSGNYVNPHGAIHTTITFSSVKNVVLELELPTLEDTWFPRYAWVIAYCERCYGHLGWKFCLVGGENGNGNGSGEKEDLEFFFGVCAGAVKEEEDTEDTEDTEDEEKEEDYSNENRF